MEYIAIVLVVVNFILIISLADRFCEYIETQDKYNDLFAEHINNIYDIAKFNNLKREAKTKEKE